MMGAARKDESGIFDAELRRTRVRRAPSLDQVYHLGPRGITFVTDTFLPEWTEVGVEMQLPVGNEQTDQRVDCRGVVVQCRRREQGRGFEVSLLFLDLPKRFQTQLAQSRTARAPLSISIAR